MDFRVKSLEYWVWNFYGKTKRDILRSPITLSCKYNPNKLYKYSLLSSSNLSTVDSNNKSWGIISNQIGSVGGISIPSNISAYGIYEGTLLFMETLSVLL